MRLHTLTFSIALVIAPAVAFAQGARTVSPGMTHAQVVAALGAPHTERKAGDYSYLFYPNACGKRCGMNDLVILHGDSVSDAIFRSPDRHYTGKSSSPSPISPAEAKREKPSTSAPLRTKESESRPNPKMKPAPANDTKPSIPLKPAVKP